MKNKIDPRFTRQLDLLEKYFVVDRENKIIEMQFKYDKASDVLDDEISCINKPLFKTEVLSTISEYLNMLPTGYKADVSILFDDLEGHNPEEISNSLNDFLELNSYQIVREGKKKWLIAALLVFFGVVLIMIKINLSSLDFFSSFGKALSEEVVDIVGWVFIWEAATVLFLSPSELLIYGIGLLKRINIIKIGTNDNNHIQTKEDIIERWQYDSKRYKFIRSLWLISSVFLMALGTSSILQTIRGGSNDYPGWIIVIQLITDTATFLLGLSGILSYIGKSRLNIIMKVFGGLLFLVSLLVATLLIIAGGITLSFTYILTTLFALVLVVVPKNKIR